MEHKCACSHTSEIGVMKQNIEPSLTHALAPAVSFFVVQCRAKDVTPDPKCSDAVLVTTATATSFRSSAHCVN